MQHCDSPMDSNSTQGSSLPYAPTDSPGSSVSSRLRDEYDELLKYAVVVPSYDPRDVQNTIADYKNSFPRANPHIGSEQQKYTKGAKQKYYIQEDEEGGEAEDDSGTDVGDQTQINASSDQVQYNHPTTPPKRKVCLPKDQPQRDVLDTYDAESSVSSPPCHDESQREFAFSMTVDSDIARMEGLMSTWLGDLNRNVLAEFGQTKIRMLEHYKHQLQREKERHAAELNRQLNETEGLKELLLTYEQSIERKDEVISNLTRAMQKQVDKFGMSKTFCEWKIHHNDRKREAFATNLAQRHYYRVLMKKVWDSWHVLVESRWKQRVERACQTKAQEVCMTLTNDYEGRIASLNEALESSRAEVLRLHEERDTYEETMKKAFMRGVCALNLEAMTMFQGDEEGDGDHQQEPDHMTDGANHMTDGSVNPIPGGISIACGLPMTTSQENMYGSEKQGAPSPRIITSTGASSSRSTISQASSIRSGPNVSSRTKAGQKGKVISAKLSGRAESILRSGVSSANVQLGPPMSSVIVERHQPITKATVGKATASQYPQGSQGGPAIVQRRIAGQHKQMPVMPNIQTIKMVE